MIYAQVLSRTNKGDRARFQDVLKHIDARRGEDRGQLMGLDELFEKVGATHDQRLRVVFTLVMYTNGPWSVVDGQEPRRMLETASVYAPCTRPLVETRLRFLASAKEYPAVEALIAGVLKTPGGYMTAKEIAEELKATSRARKDVPVPERRERLIRCFDEARADSIACIEVALDEADTVAPMAALIRETELRERLATTLSAVEVAWASRRDAPAFFLQGQLERRRAEVAFAALETAVDELLEDLYEIYCVCVSAQRAATHGRERRLELVDALRELDQGGSVVKAAARCAERIDAEVVRCVASLFRQAAAAERANNSDALSRLLDTVDATVDVALDKVAADERRLCDQLEAPLKKAEAERRAAAAEAKRRAAAERRAAERRAAAERGETNQNRVDAARKQRERQRAERAAQTDGADKAVDPVARWRTAVARTDSLGGAFQNQCVMVDREASMLTPPENAGEAPKLKKCLNFGRNTVVGAKKGDAGKNCSMCGCENKGTLTSPNVDGVSITNQTRDVCRHCIGAVWRHVATGYSLRFCKSGCKNFRHVHEFTQRKGENVAKDFDPFTTTRCFECRAKQRETQARKRSRE